MPPLDHDLVRQFFDPFPEGTGGLKLLPGKAARWLTMTANGLNEYQCTLSNCSEMIMNNPCLFQALKDLIFVPRGVVLVSLLEDAEELKKRLTRFYNELCGFGIELNDQAYILNQSQASKEIERVIKSGEKVTITIPLVCFKVYPFENVSAKRAKRSIPYVM